MIIDTTMKWHSQTKFPATDKEVSMLLCYNFFLLLFPTASGNSNKLFLFSLQLLSRCCNTANAKPLPCFLPQELHIF